MPKPKAQAPANPKLQAAHHPPVSIVPGSVVAPVTAPNTAAKSGSAKDVAFVASIFIVIILIILAVLAFLLAKTGIVEVPLFSRFYKGPVPTRIIEADPIDPQDFQYILSDRLIKQIQTTAPPYKISISEEELSGALRSVIDTAFRDQGWEVENVQLAVLPESVEFWGEFKQGYLSADILIKMKPIVEDGGLRFETLGTRLGDYPVPSKLADQVAGLVFGRDLGTWLIEFEDIAFQKIDMQNGFLVISAAPQNQ
ncbi:hypothetical protein KKE33_00010 [Patescibacteria group bacterium]|nr:hypothetical protein [Patescibacteria group bacterium]